MWHHFQNYVPHEQVNTQQSQLFSFPLNEFMKLGQNINILPSELRHLFQTLFNDKKVAIQLNEILPFKPIVTSMPFCNKKLSKKDTRFRCFDCLIHENLILCEECFRKGQHRGHRYIQTQDQGICDCGNKQVMKTQNFCPNHSAVEDSPKISEQLQFMFKLVIKQLFIWGLYLYSYDHAKEGLQLIQHLIVYLQRLNHSSLVYNTLTTFILFADQTPLIHHLFNITLSENENRCYQLLPDLLLEMLTLRQFCQKMVIAYLQAYKSINRFQESKYDKLFYNYLFSNSKLIQRVMIKNPIALIPCSPSYNSKAYFQSLYFATTTLSPAASSAFLNPILSTGYIKLPFLDEIMKECQEKDSPIINIFTQHIQEEFLYYKLMMVIIGKQNRIILKVMFRNYYKMMQDYQFSKNKIILAAQRIFIMLIYQYYNFDLQQINCQQLSQIIDVSIDNVLKVMGKLGSSFVGCLSQFAANISRTTYFDNYLPIYLKESQIVLVDYLAIKIIAIITNKVSKSHFADIIIEMYDKQNNNRLLLHKDEEIKEFIRKWNNLIKILAEICLSPRTQLVLSAFLGAQPNYEISKELLISIFNKTGETNNTQFEYIKILFFGKNISKEVLDECVVFNKKSKKFSLQKTVKEMDIRSLNTQFFVSLLKSNLNKIVTKQQTKFRQSQFTKQQAKMLQLLMKNCFLEQLILKQFKIICQSSKDFIVLFSELIIFAKSLLKMIGEECLNRLFEKIILYAIQKSQMQIIESKVNLHQTKLIDVEEIKQFIYHQQDQNLNQTNQGNKDVNRKRQLQQNRKIQKLKKMKLNQQKILANYEEKQQNNSADQVCLICKDSSNSNELCYIGRVKNTNIIFNLLNISGYNFIFHSCYHTVHFSCFMDMIKTQHVIFCPLCKTACNTIFPMSTISDRTLLSIINLQMEMAMKMTNKIQVVHQIIVEGTKYFGYLILTAMNSKMELSQKEIKLCQLIYTLMKNNHFALGELFDYESMAAQLYPHKYDTKQIMFDFKTFIQLIFKIVIETFDHQEIQTEKIAEEIVLLYDFMPKDQVKFTIQILDRILPASGEHSALKNIRINLDSQSPNNVGQVQNKFNLFFDPPKTIHDLLNIRDAYAKECKQYKLHHHICICIICKKGFCQQCGEAKKHAFNYHQKQCLFFNIQTGGLNYFSGQSQLCIRSLYINHFGKVWCSQYQAQSYKLDEPLYEQTLNCYKIGNLYYFLTHHFDGLKDKDIHDRI